MKQIIDTKHGRMAIHHEKDYISRCLMSNRQYEWYVVELMNQLSYPNLPGTILDIGANIGTKCLPLAVRFPQHQIHSWELQPRVADMLEENIALNSINNITVHRCGLGSHAETITIKQPVYNVSENIGAFSINPLVHQHSDISYGTGDEVEVEIKCLDSYRFDLPIQCIKLDAEGSELSILEGAVETLKTHRYPPIIYELWSYNPWWDEEGKKIDNLIRSWGYSIQRFDDTAVCIKQK